MANTVDIQRMLGTYPIISDQVNQEQLRVILSELEKILGRNVDGAVVEFGCYIGTTSLFIRRILDLHNDNREFHVYDSFEGLPEKSPQDSSSAGEQFKAGELAVSKKQFIREFQKVNLRMPIVHKRWFSDLTPADVPSRVAFAFLDGDFYESIKDSLKLVLPRLAPGATIIIDDYAREALPGAARATDELLPKHLGVQTIHNLGIIHL